MIPTLTFQETGFAVKVDGFDKTFRGITIGPFSTDNLGAHMIGGYNESFNCLRICRVCMATKNDIQTSVSKFSARQYHI